jgi:L-ascorbate metabolism protein UlaG (beta-lactamase superfamily)
MDGAPSTTDATPAAAGRAGRSLTVTWLGHSSVVVEMDGVVLVTDPVLRSRVLLLRRTAVAPRLPAHVDAVLISHVHYDHLDRPSLRLFRPGTAIVVPRGAGTWVPHGRFQPVFELGEGDRAHIQPLTVQATHAEHPVRRRRREVPALGYLLSGSQRVYFAGDTDLFDGMADLASELDGVLLPISGWGRHVPAGHLTPERAAMALEMLRPRWVIPVHWGTYAGPGGRHVLADPGRPVREFAEWSAQRAPGVEVLVPEPGVAIEIPSREQAASSPP